MGRATRATESTNDIIFKIDHIRLEWHVFLLTLYISDGVSDLAFLSVFVTIIS